MESGSVQYTFTVAGKSVGAVVQRSATGIIGQDFELSAAKAGTLSTRTNDTAGTLTLSAEHGILEADIIDIFWADGGVAYKAVVGVVAGNDVPFTGALGDVLPAEDTAITADVQEAFDVDFDGDKLELLAVVASKRSHITFEDSGNAVLDAAELVADEPYQYVANTGATNPLEGNPVDEIKVTCGDSTAATTITIVGLYNSDA